MGERVDQAMSELDPYVPPKSGEDVPLLDEERRRRVDVMLRWVGAVSMGCLVVVGLVRWESGEMVVKLATVVVWSGIFSAFVYGGRRWQLGVAIFMLVILLAQVQAGIAAMSLARKVNAPVSADEWWRVGGVSLACAVTVVCGVALFVRGWKRGSAFIE